MKATDDRRGSGRRLLVVESFGPPHARTNPDLPQLVRAMPAEIDLHYRSWSRLLFGRYDVFHVHWPEVLVVGGGRLRTVLRAMRLLAVLVRLRLTHRALVRTFHNERPHDAVPQWVEWILALADRWTTLWIVLNRVTPPPTDAPAVYAPIGHSRAWFTQAPEGSRVPGRLLYFGFVRPYKGIEGLLDAFVGVDDPGASLHVVGRVRDDALGARLAAEAARDPRITVRDAYVDDDELAREVAEAELVVLPFTEVTNSGSMMVALSLDRPILVPRITLTEDLAREVGESWVHTFEPPLRPAELQARRDGPPGRPDLSARDWSAVAAAHARAFTLARHFSRNELADLPYNEGFTLGG